MDKTICPDISIFSSEGESQPPSSESEKILTEGESQPSSKSHIHTDTKAFAKDESQPLYIGLQFINAFSLLDEENQLSEILISEERTCLKARNRERPNRQTKKRERSHQLAPQPPSAATEKKLKSYPQY